MVCILCLLDCLLAFKNRDLRWPKIFKWLLMKSTVEQLDSRSTRITSFSNAGSFTLILFSLRNFHLITQDSGQKSYEQTVRMRTCQCWITRSVTRDARPMMNRNPWPVIYNTWPVNPWRVNPWPMTRDSWPVWPVTRVLDPTVGRSGSLHSAKKYFWKKSSSNDLSAEKRNNFCFLRFCEEFLPVIRCQIISIFD